MGRFASAECFLLVHLIKKDIMADEKKHQSISQSVLTRDQQVGYSKVRIQICSLLVKRYNLLTLKISVIINN